MESVRFLTHVMYCTAKKYPVTICFFQLTATKKVSEKGCVWDFSATIAQNKCKRMYEVPPRGIKR